MMAENAILNYFTLKTPPHTKREEFNSLIKATRVFTLVLFVILACNENRNEACSTVTSVF